MKKRNSDAVLRREDLAADVERFLNSGKKIEKIAVGVSAQVALRASKQAPAQREAKKTDEAPPAAPPAAAQK